MVRCLDEFNQDAFTTERKLLIAFGVNKADVVARSTLTDAARCKAHALPCQVFYGDSEVIHPESNVVERRFIDPRFLCWVKRLHDIDLHGMGTLAQFEDVFVNVLALAAELGLGGKSQDIDPQMAQALLISTSDRDLLHTKYLKGARHII